jgi:hypothetical protein
MEKRSSIAILSICASYAVLLLIAGPHGLGVRGANSGVDPRESDIRPWASFAMILIMPGIAAAIARRFAFLWGFVPLATVALCLAANAIGRPRPFVYLCSDGSLSVLGMAGSGPQPTYFLGADGLLEISLGIAVISSGAGCIMGWLVRRFTNRNAVMI